MGSSNQQLYSLSWGEFGSSLTSAVQLLRGQGDLVDVTLAAGGKSFPAHKIVLSAASPFLLDLLKSTPCQHPVVMLAGVGAEDLESLLEFVYRGEVSVEPSQLPSLLQAAHCLSIHGLTPPTILTENGEEIPASAIPSGTEPPTREIMNTCMPMQRKKKRRKSSSTSMPSGKWPRSDHGDSDDRGHDSHHSNERTTDYEHSKDGESGPHDDMAGVSPADYLNHRSTNWHPASQQSGSMMGNVENSHHPHHHSPLLHQHQHPHHQHQHHPHQQSPQLEDIDVKPNIHTLMPMQQYSPLHIPSFPGSLAYPPGVPILPGSLSAAAAAAAVASSSSSSVGNATSPGSTKIRGASDCPGVCPLCGATLRQARNLRRHLLSSCKYRFNNHPAPQTNVETIEIKPEVEMPGYTGNSMQYANDSGGSNSCERIVCKPSPLPSPSPHGSNVVSPHSNIPSPTIAR
ncbi:protein abrupt-like isoform X1 [Venturia canescens]|nr:protein abrupt-like isoform X1 [Venturia canescens]XP_043278088.1 protein abrupt-like isoform X1 [Venturia canescens]